MQEQFIFHAKGLPGPTAEKRHSYLATVFDGFQGSKDAVAILQGIAFEALARYNHVSNEKHVALLGPAGSERADLVRRHNKARMLPLVEFSPSTAMNEAEMFNRIRTVAQEVGLPLVELEPGDHYILPPMDIVIEDVHELTQRLRQKVGWAILSKAFEPRSDCTVDCKNIHWILTAPDAKTLCDAFSSRVTSFLTDKDKFALLQICSQGSPQDRPSSAVKVASGSTTTIMNDLPRQKLKEIVAQYGHTLVRDDPKRLEGLLRDHCPDFKGEVFVLVQTLKAGLAVDVLDSSHTTPWELFSARWVQRLADQFRISEEAARWAVEAWTTAFGQRREETARMGLSTELNDQGGKNEAKRREHEEEQRTQAEQKQQEGQRRLEEQRRVEEQRVLAEKQRQERDEQEKRHDEQQQRVDSHTVALPPPPDQPTVASKPNVDWTFQCPQCHRKLELPGADNASLFCCPNCGYKSKYTVGYHKSEKYGDSWTNAAYRHWAAMKSEEKRQKLFEKCLLVLRKHFSGTTNPYLHPGIPERKKTNVRAKYASYFQEGEEILLIYDGTVFGSAKDGFMLTTHGIGWAAKFGEPHYCTYQQLDPDGIRKGRSAIIMGVGEAYVSPGDVDTVFTNLLRAVQEIKTSLFEEQP